MADVTTSLLAGGFALGGVLVAQLGTRLADTGKWRREWVTSRVIDLRDFYRQVIEALNAQGVIVGLCASAVKGFSPGVDLARVREADDQWRRVLSLAYLTATSEVQIAMGEFDQARERAVLAVNSKVWVEIDSGLADLQAARSSVLACMNEDVQSFNEALAEFLVPVHRRWWRRLRGRRIAPNLTGPPPPAATDTLSSQSLAQGAPRAGVEPYTGDDSQPVDPKSTENP